MSADNARSSASITLSVWNAIFLREAVSRVSGGRAAWVWLLLEPVAHLTVLLVVLSALFRFSWGWRCYVRFSSRLLMQ
jgi:capsular polysaccharide transport system permease protein